MGILSETKSLSVLIPTKSGLPRRVPTHSPGNFLDLKQQMAFLEGDCGESEDDDNCGNDCDEYCADDNMDDLDYSSVE